MLLTISTTHRPATDLGYLLVKHPDRCQTFTTSFGQAHVHGCFDELCELLTRLGYNMSQEPITAYHPEGRKAVFLGDLVDRGPNSPDVLRLVMVV